MEMPGDKNDWTGFPDRGAEYWDEVNKKNIEAKRKELSAAGEDESRYPFLNRYDSEEVALPI